MNLPNGQNARELSVSQRTTSGAVPDHSSLEITRRNLQTALKERRVRVYKPKSAVLFQRGEQASVMFVVLSGKVSLDFGVDSAFARSYGPGALVGLPATLTGRNYTMTATVTENAELVVWTREALDTLLRNRPDLCQQLLTVLGERMAENQSAKALLTRNEQPHQEWDVV